MAVPGGCVAVVNAGGVTANNVSGRGLLPREADAAAIVGPYLTLYMHHNCPGNASFKNRAMVSHAQMLPACDTIARFLKAEQEISSLLHKAGIGGGSALWRNWQIGRWCMMDGALLKWREGNCTARKKRTTAGPKKQKARQTVALAQKKERVPPLLLGETRQALNLTPFSSPTSQFFFFSNSSFCIRSPLPRATSQASVWGDSTFGWAQ